MMHFQALNVQAFIGRDPIRASLKLIFSTVERIQLIRLV